MSGMVTRATGASRSRNASSATTAAISAPNPPVRKSSCTIRQRRVRRTRRCLIVHEDLRTGGFGAEIAAVVADEAFLDLDAPVARVTMPDIPSPHHPSLLDHVLPSVARIRAEIDRLV